MMEFYEAYADYRNLMDFTEGLLRHAARSFRALWMLEELGLPYELRMLPFPPRVLQKTYLDINPLGTIPLLLDGPSRLTESAAICQYLAVKHSPRALNVEPDEPGFADYLNFLHFGEATLTFPQTLVLRYTHFEPPERRQPQVAADYIRWFLARLRTVPRRLSGRSLLAPTPRPLRLRFSWCSRWRARSPTRSPPT